MAKKLPVVVTLEGTPDVMMESGDMLLTWPNASWRISQEAWVELAYDVSILRDEARNEAEDADGR